MASVRCVPDDQEWSCTTAKLLLAQTKTSSCNVDTDIMPASTLHWTYAVFHLYAWYYISMTVPFNTMHGAYKYTPHDQSQHCKDPAPPQLASRLCSKKVHVSGLTLVTHLALAIAAQLYFFCSQSTPIMQAAYCRFPESFQNEENQNLSSCRHAQATADTIF